MIKRAINKLKNFILMTYNDVKGLFNYKSLFDRSEAERKKDLPFAGVAFIAATLPLILAIFSRESIYIRGFLFYTAVLTYMCMITILTRTYITRGKKSVLKIILFFVPTSLLVLLFLPLHIIAKIITPVLDKMGFISIRKNTNIFAVGIAAIFATCLIAILLIPRILLLIPNCNVMTILMTAIFILGREVMILTIYLFFRFQSRNEKPRKGKIKTSEASPSITKVKESLTIDNEYANMKKEVAIIVYGFIAIITTIIYFFDLEAIYPDNQTIKAISDSILYAFSLYTAFEALEDKRKARLGMN